MKELSSEKYNELFEKRVDKALERAWLNRDFEISHYWKRAAYFWTFIAVDFAGYFALVNSSNYQNNESLLKLELILICLGYIFSLAWILANLGSKKWQQNWENHIVKLENDITGPLYKTIINKQSYSVSKINIRVNLVVLFIWVIIGFEFFISKFKIGIDNIDYFTTATIAITTILSLDMIIAGGRSGFQYYKKKPNFFIDSQNKENMNGKINVKSSLKTDSMEGWGWISKQLINENGFYKIKSNAKRIICYLRTIDDNYKQNYNNGNTIKIKNDDDTVLVLNEYYRNQLQIIDTNSEYEVEIDKIGWFKKWFSFEYLHPNPYVRQNSRLTIISFILGIISISLTIWTIINNNPSA